jgi:hypothetical protein
MMPSGGSRPPDTLLKARARSPTARARTSQQIIPATRYMTVKTKSAIDATGRLYSQSLMPFVPYCGNHPRCQPLDAAALAVPRLLAS